jgi:glycosyltransferase involved in cell wall biosynthesis
MKVSFVQRVMLSYRKPFFDRLRAVLEKDGLDLSVYYGGYATRERGKADAIDLPWGTKVGNIYFGREGRCPVYQGCFHAVKDSALIVVEQANRLILNYLLLAGRSRYGYKLALWGHGYNRKESAGALSSLVKERMLTRSPDWWFAYTDGTAAYLVERGVSREQVTTVYNSIDTRSFGMELEALEPDEVEKECLGLGLAEGAVVGVFCGSLYEEKRIAFLISAARTIRRSLPGFELVIIGGGPDAALAMDASAKDPWIHYVGPKFGKDKAILFRRSRIFLHPGAVGLAILDAFTAGLPFLTTDIPGHGPEIDYLHHGSNGLVTVHDIDEYARSAVGVLRDRDLVCRMSVAAKRSAQRYSIDSMTGRFREGILRCLSLPGGEPVLPPNPAKGGAR